jgi:phosphoribosylamine--glycine ligase
MKILCIDPQHAYLDWLLRCQRAGHDVKWFLPKCPDGTRSTVGDGLVEKVKDFESWLRWADLIFLTDNAKYLFLLESYREHGYPIFGPSVEAGRLELERKTGQAAFKAHGINIMPSKSFTSYDQAIAHVMKERKRFVSKPDGDVDKALSYVAKDAKDMISKLDNWKRLSRVKTEFILQEFVPGMEMAVGAWYGPGGFNSAINENWEFKKHMPGDLGVNTGEQGTVIRYVAKSKLFDKVLKPLEPLLKKLGYTGYVDIAVIINEKGEPMPLEFTCRPGYPHSIISFTLHKGDPANWMYDLLHGVDSLEVSDDIAIGVVVSLPNYPYKGPSDRHFKGIPFWADKDHEHIHPVEICAGQIWDETLDGKIERVPGWTMAGNYAAIVTAHAGTVGGAARRVYRTIKEDLHIPMSPGYRIDIGLRLKKQLPEFQKHGFAMDMEY